MNIQVSESTATNTVIVEEDRVTVVSVGTQGPPGPLGPPGPVGPQGPAYAPAGAEGAVIFKSSSAPSTDGDNFNYDVSTKVLKVNALSSTTLDGGNF